MKVGHAFGISVDELPGGRWRLRWRQWEEQPGGGRRRAQKSLMAYSVDERKRLEVEIEQALSSRGWYTPDRQKARPASLNLEEVALSWLQFKVGIRGVAAGTRRNLAGSMGRFFGAVREVHGLGKDQVVPGELLVPRTVTEAALRLRGRYAESTVYKVLTATHEMWTWAADQPEYAALARPPHNRETVVPLPPLMEAPELYATWAECDAMLRRMTQERSRRVATIMRYTGLRVSQVLHIFREDFDLDGCTLAIRTGKSRREKSEHRTVAVSTHLVTDLGEWIASCPPGPLFPRGGDVHAPMSDTGTTSAHVVEAWRAATTAGEVREDVWMPPDRRKGRPNHVFRASFQGFLGDEEVKDSVIDFLVGHAPVSTRGRHYARPGLAAQRKAVGLIPAIDWTGEPSTNVIQLRSNQRTR